MRPDPFSARDLVQLKDRGISLDEARRQLALLATGAPPMVLRRPCVVGDGIVQLEPRGHETLLAAADQASAEGRVSKFVPASGAATRMFADLIAALAGEDRPSARAAAGRFFAALDAFPFSLELRRRAGIEGDILTPGAERTILRTLLSEMRYAQLPKGLIPFHRDGEVRTPFEEHLLESAGYARARDGIVRSHFTVAPEFRHEFLAFFEEVRTALESRAPGTRFDVTFSVQQPSTDTLALDEHGQPFRTSDSSLLFRPAGHGALLENLRALGADLVAIKNIDNVVPFARSREVVLWKRLLIGYLVTMQSRMPRDRPLRVCGVVRNEGEPGGAPFWVVRRDGRESAQIVESSQIDRSNPEQQRIFESATHFNPVDLVCAVRSPAGEPFDLQAFVDESAVFVSAKSHEGRPLTALERPGLWNGAMADWHTVFVEVPGSTFAPVKTVFDLLRPEHQSL
jgi:hypothetical protein